MIKDKDLIFIGTIGLAGFLFYKWVSNRTITDTVSGDLPGFPMMPGTNQAALYEPRTQITQPVSADFQSMIFTPTTEGAADRFIIAPNSGGGGVYDRFAQQSIRTQTATTRAIFGTPSPAPIGGGGNASPSPAIKKLFSEGKYPQSVMK